MLGAALLLPLFLLLREAEARFEFQRRLRHEIVAERVFDEMERELTALLEHERTRPSSAYDNPRTRVDRWSPFVVGYFRYDGRHLHLPAESQLSEDRKARVAAAVKDAEVSGGLLASLSEEDRRAPKAAHPDRAPEGDRDDAADAAALKTTGNNRKRVSQAAVLRQLNRATSTRGAKQRKLSKRKRASPGAGHSDHRSPTNAAARATDDPLSGLDGL